MTELMFKDYQEGFFPCTVSNYGLNMWHIRGEKSDQEILEILLTGKEVKNKRRPGTP